MNIEIVKRRAPAAEYLEGLAVFPWTYDSGQTCYSFEGDVIVTPENGAPLHMGVGDLVNFPAGLRCTRKIRQVVRKHHRYV